MFLLACVVFDEHDRRPSLHATVQSLRRVGADVVVVLGCERGTAQRIRKETRYRNIETHTAHGRTVSCLSNTQALRRAEGGGALVCDVEVGGATTTIVGVNEERVEIFRVVANTDPRQPRAIVAGFTDDLDATETVATLEALAVVDAQADERRVDGDGRYFSILTQGLRVYGEGVYRTPSGPAVHWARLGY